MDEPWNTFHNIIMERKIKSENQIICHICGKMYTSIKYIIKHEINHEDKKLNTKVKIKTQVKSINCAVMKVTEKF